jgi:hypothetical protein
MDTTLLVETEHTLAKHDPSTFDTSAVAWPECIEFVRVVEDAGAWQGAYPSLDAFYAAHEALHPDIRLYACARREIETADPLTSPGGLPSQRLARLRTAAEA